MNNTPLGIYYMCDADVCSFVLVSRLFGLALEANRHVPRLILQDVATHILPHVLIAFEYTIDGTAIYLFIYYYSIKNEYIIIFIKVLHLHIFDRHIVRTKYVGPSNEILV